MFPSPPHFEAGEVTKPCPLCRKSFLEADFSDDTWWSRSDWKAHIQKFHGTFWQGRPGNIFQPLHPEADEVADLSSSTNICPLCCLPLEEYRHINIDSKNTLENTERDTKRVRFDVPKHAESQIDERTARDATDIETKAAAYMKNPVTSDRVDPTMDLMMDHIADHLQVLALLTLRLSTENLADGEIHAISSSQAPSDDQGSGKRSSLDGESDIFFEEDVIQEIDQDASLVEMSQIDVTIPDITWPEDEWTATRLKDLREETSSPDPILLHLYKRQFARPTKWALLIACPYGKLEGPINDVKSMHALLERHGFEVVLCCGIEAVRDAILNSWNELISKVKEGDAVVVYYSGFGGIAELPLTEADDRVWASFGNWAGQFRHPDVSGQFRGILDVEISALVRRTTDITENVTIIFDCCHSGRIARDPWHDGAAVPKNLPLVYHKELFTHLQWLRSQGIDVQNYGGLERNKLAVRVVAAADSETSWEYVDEYGRSGGALTKALVPILDQALKANASWKDVIARVCEQVNCRFPRQNPQAEGPHMRLIFSMIATDSSPINATEEDGDGFIRWSAAFPNELEPFMGRLVESIFLKPIEKENEPIVFVHIRKWENTIYVYNASGFKYGSFIFESEEQMQDSVERAIELAERCARANHIFFAKSIQRRDA
ncbi:hypothetical protein TrVFT333_009589 [Trichoderma virens FT-333]|nr:hypothetical protein TrVFT333_009589 [Trichoderma virens FT-333]